MELKCPHCGKSQSLSLQSLRASDGMVICPQCVSEFHIDLKALPQQPEPVAVAAEAPVQQHADGFAFCPICGKHLPAEGLNFCPYCGHTLTFESAPVALQAPAESPTESPHPAKSAASAERELSMFPFVHTTHYSPQVDEPVSLRFKIMAWAAIAVLVALFVLMVWAGNGQAVD
ncbi:MAG: zinc ribbon domain-containing protein [Sodaliphilus sp.]